MSGTNLRFINTLILVLIAFLCLTGIYGLFFPSPSVLFDLHRIVGWALILLIPWKIIIAFRSLRRGLDRRFDRSVMILISILIAIATLMILVFGLMWKWNLGTYYIWLAGYGYSAIGWHWGIALYFLLPLFALHTWRRWHHPKKTDFSGRRQALKLIGLGIASIAAWRVSEAFANTQQNNASPRRFTGSREEGSFTGNAHPVTTGPNQGTIKIDSAIWTLQLGGAVKNLLRLDYAEILILSTSEITATLDCTGGWYTDQIWRGVFLKDLLNRAEIQKSAIGVVLKGISEYKKYFTLEQVQEILLATHVEGEVLKHVHGFPLRAVVPSRRGWHWVKWLTEIEVVTVSNL
jgi:Oxidoreductase molybdopterin binding domain